MLLNGEEDTVSKPKDTDTALLSSAVVGHAQVSAVSERSPGSFIIINDFDVSSISDALDRKAIFSESFGERGGTTKATLL